jgi:predicted transcriptional regulator
MTQEEVAKRMRAPIPHVTRMESGKTEPRMSSVLRFVEALGAQLTLVADRPSGSDPPKPKK